jgi:aryl-alcohol dehydrogenase-like predicted oxidoreductase
LPAAPQFVTEERLDRVERLAERGEKHDHDLLEIGIGALAARPGCSSVIAGATSPEQVIANAAAGEWIPTEHEPAVIGGKLFGRPSSAYLRARITSLKPT